MKASSLPYKRPFFACRVRDGLSSIACVKIMQIFSSFIGEFVNRELIKTLLIIPSEETFFPLQSHTCAFHVAKGLSIIIATFSILLFFRIEIFMQIRSEHLMGNQICCYLKKMFD